MDMDDVYDVILVPYECGNVASYYLAERTVMDNLDIGNGSFSRQYEYAYVVKDGYYLCMIYGVRYYIIIICISRSYLVVKLLLHPGLLQWKRRFPTWIEW